MCNYELQTLLLILGARVDLLPRFKDSLTSLLVLLQKYAHKNNAISADVLVHIKCYILLCTFIKFV